MKIARLALLCASILAAPALAQSITGGSCSDSNLNGTYSLSLNGRIIAKGSFSSVFEAVGTAVFDGNGNVTMAGTSNTNQAAGKQFSYSGTYIVPTNCLGTITLTQGSSATFAVVVWSNGAQFDFTGSDPASAANPNTYVYSGNGSSVAPPACATASLSGTYIFDATGVTLSGTSPHDAGVESGVFQFDGQGNLTASYTLTTSEPAGTKQVTSMGTYSVGSNCLGSASLTDSNGAVNALNFALAGTFGENPKLLEANPSFIRIGQSHAAFTNPTQSIANVASYAVNATPPGSVFALFGVNLATKPAGATTTTLPTTLLNTTVTVNGTAVPLFYADTGQIDAQMPWAIPGNTVATVIVKNGTSTSNAAAVYVPAGATPGISVFGNNRAVVVNADGVTTNNANTPAAVGDEVVVYFTGGGPVTASGKLVTGSPAPPGLSPVSGASPTITVGGMNATIEYVGLTPGSIGLYQANFIVPQLVKGTYPVVITIGGVASNSLGGPDPNPVMTVSN